MRVSCVHRTEATIAEFESAAPPGIRLTHYLRRSSGPKISGASVRTETDLLVRRASRASEVVVITCPDMVEAPLACTVSYPSLVQDALSTLTGTIEVLGSVECLSPGMEAAAVAVGARVVTVESPPAEASKAIAQLIAESQADHIVLLHAAGPTDDPRVKLAAELALDRLAHRNAMPG